MKQVDPTLVNGIAAGAWSRLRNLIGALDRIDRLDTSTEFAGWLESITQERQELPSIVSDFFLRTLHIASEPLNWRILSYLGSNTPSTIGEIIRVTRLGRVELVERMNELSRAGLTIQELEGERVESTELSRHLLLFVDSVGTEVLALAANDHMLNPMAKPPSPHAIHAQRRGQTGS